MVREGHAVDLGDWHSIPLEQVVTGLGVEASGPSSPQVFLASNPTSLVRALSGALSLGVEIPDLGPATYLGVCLGLQSTGGFSIEIKSLQARGSEVEVQLGIREPGPSAFTIQVISSPFAVAAARGLTPEGRSFTFLPDRSWSVIRVA